MLDKTMIEKMKESLKTGVAVQVAPQLFPTPLELGYRMVEMLNIQPSDEVLEPQAGNGNLIEVCGEIWQSKGRLVAVEINHGLSKNIKTRFPKVQNYCDDFLNLTPDQLGKFDKIIMNPPFEKHQDVEHIQHAFNFLKDDGELVSVVCEGPFFRQSKQSKLFREFLDDLGADIIKLDSGTFKESGTMVNSRLIHIRK